MKQNALEFLERFITTELPNKTVDDLKNYSFWEIEKIEEKKKIFGCEKSFPDGDCSKIVYAIDYLLYYDRLPEFKIPGYSTKSEYNYTGETINTFNTLFAKNLEKREQIKKLFGADWKKIQDETQNENPFAEDFYHVYQRLGNFMLLPSKTLCDSQSINSYKGKIKSDYFDLFLQELKKLLPLNSKEDNSDILLLLVKENDFYFTKTKTVRQFLTDFYLNDYEDFNLMGEHYYHWYNNLFSDDSSRKSYKEFALNYVAQATKLINKRSEKLVEVLKEKYPELKK